MCTNNGKGNFETVFMSTIPKMFPVQLLVLAILIISPLAILELHEFLGGATQNVRNLSFKKLLVRGLVSLNILRYLNLKYFENYLELTISECCLVG